MKTITTIIVIAAFQFNSAQEFQGTATYFSKTSVEDITAGIESNNEIPQEIQKMMKERMKKMFEKTFILTFNKNESIYTEEQQLESNDNPGARMMSSVMGTYGKHYKNIKDKRYISNKEFFGKEFLIKDTLPNLKWKIGTETKKIGDYNCYKATTIITISATDVRNAKFPVPNNREEKSIVSESHQTPKETTITAWYCLDIPISQGPENYWGLPGLILEINDGKTTILCTKLVLNNNEKLEIIPAKNGKSVTQKEFDEIVIKKRNEMSEMGDFRPPGPGGFNSFGR
ncbi:GLPGLI family protein [Flavobacterium sp. TBRC 19031]|uniref:GLPGLI family protein n=1 Tax=Flavobacterium mekongense TaxID=3379707 RepID=UPI00399A0E5F